MTFKSERHVGMKNRLTFGRYFSYILSWRPAFRLSHLLVTQESTQSSGLAAALSSCGAGCSWWRASQNLLVVEKHLPLAGDSGLWTPIAVPILCCLGLVCVWQEGVVFCPFFFPSRIILARDFLVFTEFAKKELPVVQQKVCMGIVYFHLNAVEF